MANFAQLIQKPVVQGVFLGAQTGLAALISREMFNNKFWLLPMVTLLFVSIFITLRTLMNKAV